METGDNVHSPMKNEEPKIRENSEEIIVNEYRETTNNTLNTMMIK